MKKPFAPFQIFIPLLLFWFLASCVSNHYDRTEDFNFSWKIGDLEQASLEVQKLVRDGPSRDRMLYLMEEGSIKRMTGDFDGSIRSLTKAAEEYSRWFGVHLESQTKISEEMMATIGTPEWKPYKSRVYERVMLRMYQGLNFLHTGDFGRARAEIFKIRQAINDAKEIWQMQLDASREVMASRSISLDHDIQKNSGDGLRNELEKVRGMIPSSLPEYINPAALYLESLYFLYGCKSKADIERARFSLRELAVLFPDYSFIQEDFNLAKAGKNNIQPCTYVFFETGRAPVRREKRFDLPLVFFSPTSRLPYLGIAFPVLRTNESFLSKLEVSTSNQITRTFPLADMDAIVAKEYEKDYPIELSKAIVGSMAKASLQYLATNAVTSKSDTLRSATGVGAGSLAQGLTQADWRSWSTLPKQIQCCKLSTSESRILTLKGVGTNVGLTLNVKPDAVNLIWVRSISSQTPLRLINQFSFSSS